jgi:hypothetical protein
MWFGSRINISSVFFLSWLVGFVWMSFFSWVKISTDQKVFSLFCFVRKAQSIFIFIFSCMLLIASHVRYSMPRVCCRLVAFCVGFQRFDCNFADVRIIYDLKLSNFSDVCVSFIICSTVLYYFTFIFIFRCGCNAMKCTYYNLV